MGTGFNRGITKDYRVPFCNNIIMWVPLFRDCFQPKKNKVLRPRGKVEKRMEEKSEILLLEEEYNIYCVPPNGRSFIFTGLEFVSSPWSFAACASGDLDVNDLRKTVSINTAVIPSRKSDIKISIGPELYQSVWSSEVRCRMSLIVWRIVVG